MLLSLPLFLTCTLSLSRAEPDVVAQRGQPLAGQSMPLQKRTPSRTPKEWGEWAKNGREGLISKYGGSAKSSQKRSSGINFLTNQNGDSSYFGSVGVGTPPQPYNVILDTGSSDLWLAGSDCIAGCRNVPTFNPSDSSTFVNSSDPFDITYGSGQALGNLVQDDVQMAGLGVKYQVFAVCNLVSSGLLQNPVSGLLGLAWQTIASSRATPLWQNLVSLGAWDQPVMAFHLTRFLGEPNAQTLEPGGQFTMGYLNRSLYTGDVEYHDLAVSPATYWILPLTTITVQGNEIDVPSGSSSNAAIDTGTTLVGGPEDIISQMYSQIPGSAPGTGDYQGYYTYPCNTTVSVNLAFGGKNWPINPRDFELTNIDQQGEQCLGAFFEIQTGGSAPSWIVGDTFLKNVYSVFRYNPAGVGFAELSTEATAQNGEEGTPATGTVRTPAFTVTASGLSGVPTSTSISSATHCPSWSSPWALFGASLTCGAIGAAVMVVL